MKVLILTNSIKGLYNFRRELIESLISERFEVVISAPKDDKMQYFNELGCECIEMPINSRGTNPITDIKLLSKYFRIVRSVNPVVVLTYTIKPNVYGGMVCRLLKVPYISNITGLGSAVENKGLLQKFTLLLYKVALKKANRVFFQNDENKNKLVHSGTVKKNYKVIPGSGVNLKHFHYLNYPKDKLINFLFIGRVMKEKGIENYLAAAEAIKYKYPNTVFHIIGSCEEVYKDKIKDMEQRGIVIYHGRQSDVREFHKISHCTIHPTYYPEGMSNVLLESASCGRPIITTNRAGCREIVDDEMNGYVVEQQNTQDLITKIESFLELDFEAKKYMGLKGRKKVENEFDRKIVVDAYLEDIKRTINII